MYLLSEEKIGLACITGLHVRLEIIFHHLKKIIKSCARQVIIMITITQNFSYTTMAVALPFVIILYAIPSSIFFSIITLFVFMSFGKRDPV